MGQDERLKENQKMSCFGITKNCKMEKNYMQISRGKAGKTLIAEVTRLIRLFNSSKRWESVAIHMLQVLLPLILQKQRTCQIPEQKNGKVEKRKDRSTDLRV